MFFSSSDEQTIAYVNKKKKTISKDQVVKIIEIYYDKDIEIEVRFISFTTYFKYLGSFISFILNNDYDVNERTKKANRSMGALTFLGRKII